MQKESRLNVLAIIIAILVPNIPIGRTTASAEFLLYTKAFVTAYYPDFVSVSILLVIFLQGCFAYLVFKLASRIMRKIAKI